MCKDQNELNQFDRLRAVLSERFGMELDSFALLAIVRDPVERFLSGFVDKCVRLDLILIWLDYVINPRKVPIPKASPFARLLSRLPIKLDLFCHARICPHDVGGGSLSDGQNVNPTYIYRYFLTS